MSLKHQEVEPEILLCIGLEIGVPSGRKGPPIVPVWAIWAFLPSSQHLHIKLNKREETQLATVIAWVKAHPKELLADVALLMQTYGISCVR